MPDVTCRACGHTLDHGDAIAQAAPGGGHWYCRDTDACRERMRAADCTVCLSACPADVTCAGWDRP